MRFDPRFALREEFPFYRVFAYMNEQSALLLEGNCVEKLKEIPNESVDSVITDPPYGLEFMGKDWDGADGFRRSLRGNETSRDNAIGHLSSRGPEYRGREIFEEFCMMWARECLRVLKPGGYLLAFGGARTYHRMACAVEDAGFEIRDQIMWIYGSGMPKSKNLHDEHEGWGSGLKPAHEPIVMARKPFSGTLSANVLKLGTGALNINACRTEPTGESRERVGEPSQDRRYTENGAVNFAVKPGIRGGAPEGRWPANLIHDGSEEVRTYFPEAKGQAGAVDGGEPSNKTGSVYGQFQSRSPASPRVEGDKSAARFFYCAKSSRKERQIGCPDGVENRHPTVKPLALMRYLCRLVTPTGGVVLDPFLGSGSTGIAALQEGFSITGIEQDQPTFLLASMRISAARELVA